MGSRRETERGGYGKKVSVLLLIFKFRFHNSVKHCIGKQWIALQCTHCLAIHNAVRAETGRAAISAFRANAAEVRILGLNHIYTAVLTAASHKHFLRQNRISREHFETVLILYRQTAQTNSLKPKAHCGRFKLLICQRSALMHMRRPKRE